MVIALQIVHEWSIRACGGDVRGIELRRDNGKLSVFSTGKWEKGELLMVPVVHGVQYIQLQKKKKHWARSVTLSSLALAAKSP